MQVDSETSAERCGEESASCGGSDEGEGTEVYLNASGRRTFVEHDVNAVVLHGGVEIFFHHGGKAMNLVDEKDIVGFKAGQESREITGFIKYRTGSEFEPYTEFVGNDVGKRGFAESRRSVEQGVVQWLVAHFCSLHKDAEILHDFLLSAEIMEAQRTERVFIVSLRRGRRALFLSDVKSVFLHETANLPLDLDSTKETVQNCLRKEWLMRQKGDSFSIFCPFKRLRSVFAQFAP